MSYMHSKKIIHGNLEPENILYDEKYHPHISDYELTQYFPKIMDLIIEGQINSPLLYISPERLKNEKFYEPSSDVYSFALIAYVILAGRVPYNEISPTELIQKVCSGSRPQFTEDINEKMKNLITRCWHSNIEERPSFDEIFTLLSSDFSYSKEPIDESEVKRYIEKLVEKREEFNFKRENEEDEAFSLLKQSSEQGNKKVTTIKH